jgi:alkaline phosphatase D
MPMPLRDASGSLLRHVAAGLLATAAVFASGAGSDARAAHLGMGFRVGEVTQDSAIVWTRITATGERNRTGFRDPQRQEPRVDEYVPSPVKVADREGEIGGAPGEVRVGISTGGAGPVRWTAWEAVAAEHDFTRQFRLTDLQPATRYAVKVEARAREGAPVSAAAAGSFGTPAAAGTFQEVHFGVVTCQGYWDLDHPEGYHIYPAMAKQGLDFVVPAGDCVYLDSDAPRARTVELARHHWHRMYSLPRLVRFHLTVPGYWEKDDHDAWCNDCWPTMKSPWMNPLTFEQGLRIFREQVPMGERTYRTVRWGKGLQVWFVEGRDFRSPNTMPDGPDKSIWGAEQKKWLTESLKASDATFRVLVSPTPIVGPDRGNKGDNHANAAFRTEGDWFRGWVKDQGLRNFYVCCGDRHWQYMSLHPTGLREFSCGAASDEHAGGNPPQDKEIQPFLRVKGGYLSVNVDRRNEVPWIALRHHDVHGAVVHEFAEPAAGAK